MHHIFLCILQEPMSNSKDGRYEAKRQRKWLPQWKKIYPFAQFDIDTDLMYCSTCRALPSKARGNALFVGVRGEKVRIRTLKNHLHTAAHIDCENAVIAQTHPEKAPLTSCLSKMDKDVKVKLVKLFNIAYYVAKEEEPFAKFPKLVDLQIKNGLNLGNTYKNDHACHTFIGSIADTLVSSLKEKIDNARFFSLMTDASTDRSVQEQEIIYLTFLENGLPVTTMVNLVPLVHANSQGILDAILAGLQEFGVSEEDLKEKLIGFGCDGASVMIGHKNGVAAKLKEKFPALVTIWCVAHRLELAALDSMRNIPAVTELKQIINGIYKHYHSSPKASRELNAVAEAMQIQLVKPGTIDGTRWLPHTLHAMSALVRNYPAILVHMESHASDMHDREASDAMKGRASHTMKALKQYKSIIFLHFLLDILKELKHLSLLFQTEGLTLQMVSDGLQKTTLALVAMQVRILGVLFVICIEILKVQCLITKIE